MERHISIFDIISLRNAICVPIWLHVSIVLSPVSEFWDTIICLCMWDGRLHHAKDLECKSGCMMANTFDFYLPITVKWEISSYNSDEIYWQNLIEWCHKSHSESSQYSTLVCLNVHNHTHYFRVSDCISSRTALVHMVQILKVLVVCHGNREEGAGCGMALWKSRNIYQKLVKWSTYRKLPAEYAGMW